MPEDLYKSIGEIFIKFERIESQVSRLVSDAESEKEVRKRITEMILKDIRDVENELKNILYGIDRKSGVIVDVDRLKQLSMQVKALMGVVGAIIVKIIYDIILKK